MRCTDLFSCYISICHRIRLFVDLPLKRSNIFICSHNIRNKEKRYLIRVITKLPNYEHSNKGKIKTHKYINKQISQQPENCENRNEISDLEHTTDFRNNSHQVRS